MPSPSLYRVRDGGQEFGPLPIAEIACRMERGEISARALITTDGMDRWLLAHALVIAHRHSGAIPDRGGEEE